MPISYFIKDTSSITEFPKDKEFNVALCDPQTYLHDEVYNKLSELGTLYSLVFSMRPGADKKMIHVDLDATTKIPYWPCLNILLEGQGTMKWFNPDRDGIIQRHAASVYYKSWYNNYGEEIDSWDTGKIALIRTDIPHQAWNFDSDTRRVITIRWSNRKSWEETIEWFRVNFEHDTFTSDKETY